MKKIILKKILPSLFILLGLLLLWRCEEEIISPNKNGSDVNLHISGNKLNACKGDTVRTKASYAQFAFVSKNGDKLDTLFQGKLDVNGEWDTLYNIELLGIPNVQVHGLLDLRTAIDSVFYVCCDTSFVLNFLYDCNEVSEVKVDCENLDDTINLDLTNRFGGKILLGTPEADIAGNRFQLSPTENVTVNINEINTLAGDFSKKISSSADNNGNIELGIGKQPLVIDFFVKTDKVGVFTKTINLLTTCSTGETGNITINLTSEITDNNCSCPFSSDNKVVKEFYPFSQSISEGETSPISVNEIINLNDFSLGEGCYLVVDSVVRYNSSVAATFLEQAGIQHEWKMAAQNFPIELRNGTTILSMSTTFTPNQVGESTDTFSVNVSIRNSLGETKDACSFLISYTGNSCNDNICPSITKLNDLPADLINGTNGTVIRGLTFGSKMEMGSGDRIRQTMNGLMGTLCTSFIGDNQIVTYVVNLPEIDSIVPCSQVNISVDKLADGTLDDTGYFKLINSNSTIEEGGVASFSVQFLTPDVKTYISSGHSSVYKAKLIVHATDNTGEICSQQIDLEANVSSKNYKISKSTNMKSFSQVSDKESNPSYAVYDIELYNPFYQYYGQQDKLDPDRGSVNIYSTPPTPNTGHSFFFEVDEPNNLALRQIPKLYLVNTDGNKYSMITSQPIARYNNNTEFNNDLDVLMQDVFNPSFQSKGNAPNTSFLFNSSETEIMWTPSLSAVQTAGAGNGLSVQMGEVYVLWNPQGNHEMFSSGGSTYNNYCDVAFLYIEEISDGDGSAHNIGNVTFYVVYPLTTIIQ